MHICLPDTREVKPPQGSSFLLYNVHIDGLYHCSLRFKQLLHLHQALTKHFTSPTNQLPPFPPKKLLPLSAAQIEERRSQLEKYLQNISQDKAICNSSIFNLFLLEAQRESTRIRENQVHLDIELVNGQKIRLQIVTHDSADAVLTAVCRALGLDDRYHAYFCLCLCGYDVIRDKLIIKRRLSFFESPYVTLQMAIQQQEQLQNVLTNGYSSSSTSMNASTSSTQQNSNCCCQSCCLKQQLQLQSSNSTTGVPLIGSSSDSSYVNNSTTSRHNTRTPNHYNNNNNHYHQYRDGNNNYHQYQQQLCCSYYRNSDSIKEGSTSSFVTHRILLRKSYWDPIYDTYILNDQQALNLLFIQTVYDIKHSLMFVDRETYHQLESLLASDSKLEYILLARTLKYYNYVHFEPCLSDFPRPRTKVMISIGSKELNMRVLKSPKTFSPSATSEQTSSSLSSSASSSSSSSSPASGTLITKQQPSSSLDTPNSTNQTNNLQPPTCNQQVSVNGGQILYCTSSLVPSNYHHLITKEDLVEEEYNFKVPLIRCWRLTSIETLNSNSSSLPPVERRKSLSLFGNSSNENRPNDHNNHHQAGIVNSGNGGLSLLSALAGRANGLGRTNGNNTNQHQHQHCQHENHKCGFVGPMMDQFSQYELSFEYLVSKDTLKWITISSDQAIFISISLQGVVDELVSKRDGGKCCLYESVSVASNGSANSTNILPNATARINANNNNSNFTYMYKDGSQKTLNTSNQQLIDKFGTTLGYSPMNSYTLALARQRQQVRASALLLSSRRSAGVGGALSSSSASSSSVAKSYHRYKQSDCSNGAYQQTSAFEISNLKKASSPIINDAFEGVTNEEDL